MAGSGFAPDDRDGAGPWDEFDSGGVNPLISDWSWAEEPPGAGLAAALDRLPVSALDDYDVVEAIAGWERVAAWAAAQQAIAVAEVSGRPVFAGLTVSADGLDPVRATALEIAARLRVSHQEATYRVVVAQELTTKRRATLAALSSGEIDLRRARTIVDGVQVLDADRAAAVEERLLAGAATQTPPAFRRRVEQQVAAADPTGFEDRHQRACTDRQVRCRPEPDAMGSLWALLPAAGTALVNTVLDAAADAMKTGDPGDGRTHAQRRADALVAMAELSWQTGHLGGVRCGPRLARRRGRRVEIGVLVPYPTLVGLADQPGELAGFGPIPASVARRIAAGGVWRRILTDPGSGRCSTTAKRGIGRREISPSTSLRGTAPAAVSPATVAPKPATSITPSTTPTGLPPTGISARSADQNTMARPADSGTSANPRRATSAGAPLPVTPTPRIPTPSARSSKPLQTKRQPDRLNHPTTPIRHPSKS
jgi:hypothetical protein